MLDLLTPVSDVHCLVNGKFVKISNTTAEKTEIIAVRELPDL